MGIHCVDIWKCLFQTKEKPKFLTGDQKKKKDSDETYTVEPL